MTARVVRWHEMLPSSSGELAPAVGGYRFTPTRARIISGDPDIEVLPEPFVEPLVDGKLDVALEQTGVTWVWRVERNVHHLPKTIEYVAVPAGLDPIDQTDLIRIDPETLVPDDDLTPMWFAITSIVERNVTIIGNERILAETARDEATLAKDNAELAELSSETAQSLAEAALAAAIIAQNGSEHARDEAFIAENNTNVLAVDALASADSANTSAINASNSALAASESKQAAQTAQSTAEIARAGAELAETGAEIAQTAAQTARTGAETAQGAASGYATTASQQASIAMDQAVLAAGSASDAADAETAAQTAQGLAEGARDAAAGARDAAQTAKGLAETARDAAALSASYADADRLAAQTAKGLAETARDAAALSAANASATLAGAVTKATVDAKGDLLVGSADNVITRLPVGADGSILVADSNAATGLAYKSPIPLLKNLVTNGDFSNGTTGWEAWVGVLTSGSGYASFSPSVDPNGNAYQDTPSPCVPNHVYYGAGTLTAKTANISRFDLVLRASTSGTAATVIFAEQTSPVNGTSYTLTGIATATPGLVGNARIASRLLADVVGETMELRRYMLINLTTIFGAGNEPTKTEMDYLLSKYPNSWFNGIANDLKTNYDPMRRIGKGSPYSVITPRKAGETWTDLDQTCGARVWTATGTTTTSWKVLDGDTGWRVLSSWTTAGVVTGDALTTGFSCTSGVAGKIQIRRINKEVMYRIYGATLSVGTQITYRTGFGITGQYVVVPVYMNDTITTAKIGGPCIYMGAGVTNSGFGSYFKYITDDSWPTVLPGTAA